MSRSKLNEIKIYNIMNGELIKTFTGHTDSVYYLELI